MGDPHKSAEELREALREAGNLVRVGGRYRHYKDPAHRYMVTGFAVIEATDEVGVLYRAEYPDCEGMTFVRPVREFVALVGDYPSAAAGGCRQRRFMESEE